MPCICQMAGCSEPAVSCEEPYCECHFIEKLREEDEEKNKEANAATEKGDCGMGKSCQNIP